MKFFEIKKPGDLPELVEGDNNGTINKIILGEGNGKDAEIIPVIDKGPEVRVKKLEKGFVVVRGEWNDNDGRCLILINTARFYDKEVEHDIFDYQDLNIVACGINTFGKSYCANEAKEALAIAGKDAVFRLNLRSNLSVWYIWSGKEWFMETSKEREVRLSLEYYRNIEGRWL